MMASYLEPQVPGNTVDLNARLEHLITYSSQLVFISGEGMGAQLNFAQNFLAAQHEQANVAYLDSQQKFDVASYRRTLIRQLASPQRIDYARPLTETLPRLFGSDSQFILIAITHAERLPEAILQELWDLVLQNRFAKHRHHLNILLFGESAWAENAKTWLPANSHSKPVLLTNEVIVADVNKDSELERLMAHKREQFRARLSRRDASGTEHRPSQTLLQQRSFQGLMVFLFVSIFGGLLLWQHWDASRATLVEVKQWISSLSTDTTLTERAESVSIAEKPIPTQPVAETETVSGAPLTTRPQLDDRLPADQRRVTDWQSAIAAIPDSPLELRANQPLVDESTQEQSAKVLTEDHLEAEPQAVDAQVVASGDSTAAIALPVQAHAETNAQIEPQPTSVVEPAQDYAVEDIVSVEQLSDPIPEDTETARLTVLQAERAFNAAILQNLADGGFVLQLAAMADAQVLQQYLAVTDRAERTWVYRTQRFGGDWHVVLLNQRFANMAEARAAAQTLGPVFATAEPFAKAVGAVKAELAAE